MAADTSRYVEKIAGRGLPLRGQDIDTDRILPARYLKCVTFEDLETHVFEDDRQQLEARGAIHPFSNPAYQGAKVLIVNRNFGCGSSREHAPQGLQRWGIGAVLGESFSEIFFGNSLALGMPCLTLSAEDIERLMQAVEADPRAELAVDLSSQSVDVDDKRYRATLPEGARDALMNGSWDATGLLLDRFDEVREVAASLPYVQGF
jgi:3-isopropylmalate/(R)-2-methylmalate dehydratase small subunit